MVINLNDLQLLSTLGEASTGLDLRAPPSPGKWGKHHHQQVIESPLILQSLLPIILSIVQVSTLHLNDNLPKDITEELPWATRLSASHLAS